jgi:hypothetical protein
MNLPEFLKSMEAVVAGARERQTRAAKAKSSKQAAKANKQQTDQDAALTDAEPSVGGR